MGDPLTELRALVPGCGKERVLLLVLLASVVTIPVLGACPVSAYKTVRSGVCLHLVNANLPRRRGRFLRHESGTRTRE